MAHVAVAPLVSSDTVGASELQQVGNVFLETEPMTSNHYSAVQCVFVKERLLEKPPLVRPCNHMESSIPPDIGGLPTPPSTIDRSAASAAKGPRLQRIRVALFLLNAVEERDNVQAYAAVEAHGDAFVATSTATHNSAYSEEDKNYYAGGTFTFVSEAVLNSLVIFLDQWINWQFSKVLRFGFYTTVAVGKEKNAGRIKKLKLTLPEKPIIDLLMARDYSDPNFLACVKALLCDEYIEQYGKMKSKGHMPEVQKWSDDSWKEFLSLVSWLFSCSDESEAWKQLVDAVKACRFYNEQHEGKEEIIASALLDLFDQKQLAADFAEKFVHAAQVDVLFRKVASGELSSTDPTWHAWDGLPTPSDTRNVTEKLVAACPTVSKTALARYQRRTAAGLAELEAHSLDKNVVAMRYQIYDACEEAISRLEATSELTELQLESQLDRLIKVALERVTERSGEYGYPYKSEAFVCGLVLELFDSCFLNLDRNS